MSTEIEAPTPSRLDALLGRVSGAWCSTVPFSKVRTELPPDRFVKVRGRHVYVERAGTGEPVILLHGFCCSSFTWREVIPGLAKHHRVIAPDLPGFGYTERPCRVESYRFAGLARTVLELLDALGVASAHFIGHSYGGALALWLAERHPERVRTLTLAATATPELTVEQRQIWARFRSLNYLLLHTSLLSRSSVRKALEQSYHDRSLVTDELVEAYRERLLVEGVEYAYYGFLAPLEDPPPPVDLRALEMPVLAVWGDHDRIIPAERAVPYMKRFPRARMVIFDRCGHVPMEERPEAFLREVLPFLRRHRRPWHERMVEAVWGKVRRAKERLARRGESRSTVFQPAVQRVETAERPST